MSSDFCRRVELSSVGDVCSKSSGFLREGVMRRTKNKTIDAKTQRFSFDVSGGAGQAHAYTVVGWEGQTTKSFFVIRFTVNHYQDVIILQQRCSLLDTLN